MLESQEPKGSVVYYHNPDRIPGAPHAQLKPTAYMAVFVTSTTDLAASCRHWDVHSLYYRVGACSSTEDFQLWESWLLEATPTDRALLSATIPADEHLYKMWVPLDFDQLEENMRGFPSFNLPEETAKARDSGFCMEIVGGSYWGPILKSNRIKAPLSLVGKTLVATGCPQELK